MRIFRDSTSPASIPMPGADGVFGYANGRYAWTQADARRFTTAGLQVAHIDVNGTAWEEAAILDVERGDATPAQAPDWIRSRNAFRGDAVVYCALDSLPALFAACSRLTEPWRLWVADWTGVQRMPAITGCPANVRLLGTQYRSTPGYDESLIIDDAWHRAPEKT